jgi:hypothetical protein
VRGGFSFVEGDRVSILSLQGLNSGFKGLNLSCRTRSGGLEVLQLRLKVVARILYKKRNVSKRKGSLAISAVLTRLAQLLS